MTAGRHLAVLEHVSFEGPGAIADWADSRGHDLRRVALYQGETVPRPDAVDALVVMGGPMGVADEKRLPFLRAEKDLLRSCVDAGRAVLGVCLGAQLLAEALGAQVSALGHREIGSFPVCWDARGRALPPFAHVPDESVVLHWHGDSFSAPPGTVPLGTSAACSNQGFASPDGRVVGLQFHLEVRDEGVRALVTNGSEELRPGGTYVQERRAARGTCPLRRSAARAAGRAPRPLDRDHRMTDNRGGSARARSAGALWPSGPT